MTTRQAFLTTLGLIVGILLFTLVLYPALPERIPIHWNIRGEVDGWAPKFWGAVMMPGTMVLLLALLAALPAFSPKEYSIETFRPTYNYIAVIITALMGYIHVVMLLAALHPDFPFIRALLAGIFLLFALMGNVMGRVRQNHWVGVRTPWTLASNTVWIATHRLAGRLFVGIGLLGAIGALLGVSPVLCFVALIVAVFAPVIYSYIKYKQL